MLNYQYIEQLLDRYFECETTLEEEKILRTFFCQNDVPEHLLQYRELFVYEQNEPLVDRLGEEFDQKMLALVKEDEKNNKVVSLFGKVALGLRPFFKAAAIVAVIFTVGTATQVLFEQRAAEPTTSVAKVKTISGENMADMQTKDSLAIDTFKVINN